MKLIFISSLATSQRWGETRGRLSFLSKALAAGWHLFLITPTLTVLNWGHQAALSPLVWSTTTVLSFGQHYARLWRLMPTVLDRGRSAVLLPLVRSTTAVFNSGQSTALSPMPTVPLNWAVPKLFWINARSILRYCACTHPKTSNYFLKLSICFLGGKGGGGFDEHKKTFATKTRLSSTSNEVLSKQAPRAFMTNIADFFL